jgi:hypothetical protein
LYSWQYKVCNNLKLKLYHNGGATMVNMTTTTWLRMQYLMQGWH